MKRKFRLTKSSEYQRVKLLRQSYAHPLLILAKAPNHLDFSRFGIVVSKSVGKAVRRNRAKRHIREALRLRFPQISPGWDVVIIARQAVAQADFELVQKALDELLARAQLCPQIANHTSQHEDV